MPVQVFGVLVLAQVGQHAAGAVFGEHNFRDFTNDREHLEQQFIIAFFERDQRSDVALRNDDDVYRPEWSRVMICEYVAGFTNHSDRGSPAQYFIAVKVFSHQSPILRHSMLFFGTHGGVASDTAQQTGSPDLKPT